MIRATSFFVCLVLFVSSNVYGLCPNPREQSVPIKEFFWDPFDPPLNRSQTKRNATEKVLAQFGKPDQITKKAIPSRDEPLVDTVIETWTYDQGIQFILAGLNGRQMWLEQIIVSSSAVDLKLGFKIGMTWDEYWSHMGLEEPPDHVVPGYVQYCDESNVEHHIELHPTFECGLLTELVWKHIPFRQ